MDLEEVHAATEPAELAREMAATLLPRVRPDLGRHERVAPPLAERVRQDGLRAAVHRRGIDDARARLESGSHDRVGLGLASRRQVEHAPCPEPDGRDVDAAAAEPAHLHTSTVPNGSHATSTT